MAAAKRFYIQTFGCQMNVSDSDRMAALLERAGAEPVARPEEADLVLLNTCAVREKPEQKVYTRLADFRRLKRQNPELVIGVCGCQAQREGEALLTRAPWVDLVIGTANIERLPSLVEEVRRTGRPQAALELPQRGTPAWMSPEPHMASPGEGLISISPGRPSAFSVGRSDPAGSDDIGRLAPDLVELLPEPAPNAERRTPNAGRLKAFVPIILGCDFGCTFCIVPKTRGPERSRPVAEILGEIRALAQNGTREVMLLGQTVDAYKAHYHADDPPGSKVYGLADLIWLIEGVDGIERVRFTSPHPHYMDRRLIEAIAGARKACEWIHLPVQSGDNQVLKRMARRYTRERYLEVIAQIRAAMPEVAITTDIIVGFPGETREQFESTLSLVEQVQFDGAFTFAYSARPGTPAAGWPDAAPNAEKKARLNELIALQNGISRAKNERLVGRDYEVLVEGESGHQPGQFTGLTRSNKTVNFPGDPSMVGHLVSVRATQGHQWGFMGEAVA
jgi:tRNA-2-methylthio-N6-dimethylallyladenosine synthase